MDKKFSRSTPILRSNECQPNNIAELKTVTKGISFNSLPAALCCQP